MKPIHQSAVAAFLALAAPLTTAADTPAQTPSQTLSQGPAATAHTGTATADMTGHAPTDGSATAGALTVSGGYARSTNPKVGAAFMTVSNGGSTDCVLGAVSSDVAPRTEMHTHRDEAGVMKMMQVDSISIPAGETHELARGGDHIMFLDTPKPLAEGDSVQLTLDFGACGTLPLTLRVDNAAGQDAMMHGGMGAGAAGHGAQDGHAAHGAPSN